MRAFKNLQQYQPDPVAYVYDVLQMRCTPAQEEGLSSLVDHRRTAFMACHGVGKTITAAMASNWWYDCWAEHIVYITAPSWAQALGLTFTQTVAMRRAVGLPGEVLDTGLVRDLDKNRRFRHYIRAINAQHGEGFQGEHAAPILIVMEEAIGVPPFIWEASNGLMTNKACRQFAIGNPTNEGTNFGIACSAPAYHTIKTSGLDHPNVLAELAGIKPLPFPGATELTFIKEMLEENCLPAEALEGDAFLWYTLSVLEDALNGIPVTEDSPMMAWLPNAQFQGRVLGMFPTVADEQVIPRGWLENTPRRELESAPPGAEPAIGCDIAYKGSDRTVIAATIDGMALSIREIRQMDTVLVENALKEIALDTAKLFMPRVSLEFIATLRLMGDAEILAEAAAMAANRLSDEEWENQCLAKAKTIRLRIDITGGLGAGPYDHLTEQGYNTVGVNSSSLAVMRNTYPNKRSELWFSGREWAKDKHLDLSRLPPDIAGRLKKELSTPKYGSDMKGRKVVETKDIIKKRLGQSPDLADGFLLSIYEAGNDVVTSAPNRAGLPANTIGYSQERELIPIDQLTDANGLIVPPPRGRQGETRYFNI